MLMFTNNESVVAYDLKGHRKIIPSHCFIFILTCNSTEYQVKKISMGTEVLEVPKKEFDRKFIRC